MEQNQNYLIPKVPDSVHFFGTIINKIDFTFPTIHKDITFLKTRKFVDIKYSTYCNKSNEMKQICLIR